jgi:uncharacterized protein (AIM24 family)
LKIPKINTHVYADARFEVLGAPFSLLSVQLSASQNLLTRRGTLAGLSGKPDNVVSKLSLLSPFSRTIGGIPFLYQSITSTSPITALITTKSPLTSFAVVHLDGRLDWIISQRDALLAWTGQSLSVSPKLNFKLAISHWGNSHVTGRGLLALVGRGQIYQISLKSGEEYIVHPSNVVAYSLNQNPPQPYRFKSSSLTLQIPSITSWLPDTRFVREARKTSTWKFLANLFFTLRAWARRTVWGDRLFLHFRGPITILLQTRGSRLSDSLTARDVNEIADTPAGEVSNAITLDLGKEKSHGSSVTEVPRTAPSKQPVEEKSVKVTYATIGTDKKVRFQGQ